MHIPQSLLFTLNSVIYLQYADSVRKIACTLLQDWRNTKVKTRRTKLAVLATATMIVATGIGGATASAQELPGTVRIHNATQWLPNDTLPDTYCTIGAVGTDKYGREIGITAGHCFADGPYANTNIAEDIQPVFDRNNLNWREGGNERGNDPIGYLRWYKGAEGSPAGHPGRDYAIIEFVDGVQLSSQGPHIKMTGIHELPSGTIDSPYATAPAQPREKVLGTGVLTNHQLVTSSYPNGVQYGRITNNSFTGTVGIYQAGASHLAGDSGGPAVIKDASAQYPSASNGFQTQGRWVGITKARVIGYPPYTYTSSANILADLCTRDLASGQNGSVAGAGFEVTTNP